MSRLKPLQGYLKVIEKHSLRSLIALFILAYLSLSLVFGLVYYAFDLLDTSNLGFFDAWYFSFITQSTVGYGDLRPIGLGRLFAMAQALIGLVLFATGTGAIVLRMLTPKRGSIEFDRFVLFDPKDNKYRIRYVNRLPIDLYMGHIEVRLRHLRLTTSGQQKWSRKTVSLIRNTITSLPSMVPLQTSTRPVTEPKGVDGLTVGEDACLEPSHITPEISIRVVITAQYFAGNIVAAKEYYPKDIFCGNHDVVMIPNKTPNWDNWNRYTLTKPAACKTCPFESMCLLKQRL
jgi:hypothetical protein